MSPKILIAGGYGLVGSMIARHIRQAGFDAELILAGRTPERGLALASELGRAHAIRLDIEGDGAAPEVQEKSQASSS